MKLLSKRDKIGTPNPFPLIYFPTLILLLPGYLSLSFSPRFLALFSNPFFLWRTKHPFPFSSLLFTFYPKMGKRWPSWLGDKGIILTDESRLGQVVLPCRVAYSDNSTTRTRHGSNHCLKVEWSGENSLLLSGSFFVCHVLLWHTFSNELKNWQKNVPIFWLNLYIQAYNKWKFIWILPKQREANFSGKISLL